MAIAEADFGGRHPRFMNMPMRSGNYLPQAGGASKKEIPHRSARHIHSLKRGLVWYCTGSVSQRRLDRRNTDLFCVASPWPRASMGNSDRPWLLPIEGATSKASAVLEFCVP